MRVLFAHISAIFVGAIVIFAGSEVILEGPAALFLGLAKGFGGFFMWFILGLASAPLGVALRYALGYLFGPSKVVAICTGIVIGFILIPVLNPAMTSVLTFHSNSKGLLFVYVTAGALAGRAWYWMEFEAFQSKSKNGKPSD